MLTSVLLLCLVVLVIQTAALRLPARPVFRLNGDKMVDAMRSLSTASLLLPSAAHAVDGGSTSAVLVPIAISVLTIVPFLYYQQGILIPYVLFYTRYEYIHE